MGYYSNKFYIVGLFSSQMEIFEAQDIQKTFMVGRRAGYLAKQSLTEAYKNKKYVKKKPKKDFKGYE